jgi:hypothetical protein
VVAESYARIFFRNCIATGELYPVETEVRLCEAFKTGGARGCGAGSGGGMGGGAGAEMVG